MRKLFTEPVIDISIFNSENVVTGSSGTPTDVNQITANNNAVIKADWAAAESTLTFTF